MIARLWRSGKGGAGGLVVEPDPETVAGLANVDRDAEGSAQDRTAEDFVLGALGGDASVLQKQRAGDGGDDFLDVVCDHEERRPAGVAAEFFDAFEEAFAAGQVESGTRFVKDEQVGPGHQGPTEEDFLSLALGECREGLAGDGGAAQEVEEFVGAAIVGGRGPVELKADGSELSADDEIAGQVARADLAFEGGAEPADAFAEFAEVDLAVMAAEDVDFAGGGPEGAANQLQERGFAGPVGADDGPVLAVADVPGDVVENEAVVAFETDVAKFDHRGLSLAVKVASCNGQRPCEPAGAGYDVTRFGKTYS